MERAAERLVWAVDMLALDPAAQVLEVGCGAGVAVSLVCRHLVSGTITAIDRSAVMIAAASRRNRACVDAGRAVLRATSLEAAAFAPATLDTIFAFNVGLFWTPPGAALALARPLLRPGGSLWLFHQPPTPARIQPVADALGRLLPAHGFAIHELQYKDLPPAPVLAVRAGLV